MSIVYLYFNAMQFQSRTSAAMLLDESHLHNAEEARLWKKSSSFGLSAVNQRNLAQVVQRTL